MQNRMRNREPDSEEIQILKAIDANDMFSLPENYHPADLAWLSLYGYVKLKKIGDVGGLWWPEGATLTDKGKAAITKP